MGGRRLCDSNDVTGRALKRLRPAGAAKKGPRPRNAKERLKQKSAAAVDALLEELEGGPEAEERRARDKHDFDALTEAANELMSLGFEDIYTQVRAEIADSIDE